MKPSTDSLDKAKGALVGLAVGDALGTTLEFTARKDGDMDYREGRKVFPDHWLQDIEGGGPFNMPVGGWTDDTSMALCLAQSFIGRDGKVDHTDVMDRYLDWRTNGYMSHNGRCFDIGGTTSGALSRFRNDPLNHFAGSDNPMSAGNGSIMRLAPVPIRFHSDPLEAASQSGQSSKTTHGAQECVDSARYMGWLLATFIGKNDWEVGDLFGLECPFADSLAKKVKDIAGLGSRICQIGRNNISSSGYVIDSLKAAMWAFHRTSNFRDGAILVVNLGGDADTTGAIYGQIAGAYYGLEGIPAGWVKKTLWSDEIEYMAAKVFSFGEQTDDRHCNGYV